MKPPISYYGGKQRMASRIVPLLPRHTVYVEPFCGGAAVMFNKPWPRVSNASHYIEVINDLEGDLVNFYRQLRDNGDELCRMLALTPYSEEGFKECRERSGVNPAERARRYFVAIMQSFAKVLDAGWGRGVFGQNLSVTFARAVARLPEYISRMAGVCIACQDAVTIIEQWDSPQTLFYCDPPYPGTHQNYYTGYTTDDFAALVGALDAAAGNLVVSCYDVPGVEIPSDWERFEFSSCMTAAVCRRGEAGGAADRGETDRTEVVFRRWNSAPVRPEIQALYDSGAYDCFAFPPEEIARREPTLF